MDALAGSSSIPTTKEPNRSLMPLGLKLILIANIMLLIPALIAGALGTYFSLNYDIKFPAPMSRAMIQNTLIPFFLGILFVIYALTEAWRGKSWSWKFLILQLIAASGLGLWTCLATPNTSAFGIALFALVFALLPITSSAYLLTEPVTDFYQVNSKGRGFNRLLFILSVLAGLGVGLYQLIF